MTQENSNSKNTTTKDAPAETPTATPVVIKAKKPKSGAGFKIATLFLLLLALGASGTSLALSILNYNQEDQQITFNYGSDGNSASFIEGSVADVASRVAPGVVSIITETRKSSWLGSTTQTSAGTGMIVTADGYVLTCKHVVDGARNISVVLDDGTTFDGVELVGTDPLNDVAFLKIKDGKDLPTVKLGDSKTIIPGQQVIAIGKTSLPNTNYPSLLAPTLLLAITVSPSTKTAPPTKPASKTATSSLKSTAYKLAASALFPPYLANMPLAILFNSQFFATTRSAPLILRSTNIPTKN